jgi:hypothetical protein
MAWNRLGRFEALYGSLADIQAGIDAYTKAVAYDGQGARKISGKGSKLRRRSSRNWETQRLSWLMVKVLGERQFLPCLPCLRYRRAHRQTRQRRTRSLLCLYSRVMTLLGKLPSGAHHPNVKSKFLLQSFQGNWRPLETYPFSLAADRYSARHPIVFSSVPHPRPPTTPPGPDERSSLPKSDQIILSKSKPYREIIRLTDLGIHTIGEVKHAIQASEGTLTDMQHLIFQGKPLEDHCTLRYYDIGPNETIHLVSGWVVCKSLWRLWLERRSL